MVWRTSVAGDVRCLQFPGYLGGERAACGTNLVDLRLPNTVLKCHFIDGVVPQMGTWQDERPQRNDAPFYD